MADGWGVNNLGRPIIPMKLIRSLISLALLSSTPAWAAGVGTSILKGGAVGDGVTLCTNAIQKTIDKVAVAGGGTVVVPQGVFLTGALFLKPTVNLHLDEGAVLQGTKNIEDYPRMLTRIEGHTQIWRPALLNADGVDHLRITGKGMIRGGGKFFWDAFWNRLKADNKTKNLDVDRPRNIFIQNCHDVVLSGISLRDSGFWNLHMYRCQNVVVDGLDIETPPHSPSTDGIDVDSCQYVEIRHCHISVDDDNVCLKGTKGPLSMQDKRSAPVEHIHIHDCTFGLGHGVLTLGSEASVVRDVEMDHCTVSGPDTAPNVVLRLKLRPDTEQHYENIRVHDIKVDGLGAIIHCDPYTQYFDLKGLPAPHQTVNGVTMSAISGSFGSFGSINGPAQSTVRNVVLKDMDLRLAKTDYILKNVQDLVVTNVKINGALFKPPGPIAKQP
jgi:polygalacturonase